MAQRKETKTKIKVRDLKPKKDAKGGVIVDVSTQTHQQSHSVQGAHPNLNRPGFSHEEPHDGSIRSVALCLSSDFLISENYRLHTRADMKDGCSSPEQFPKTLT